MKTASGTTGIKPAIGTAAAHLAVHHNAAGPWTVALVAILTRDASRLTSNVSEQSFNIASTCQVQHLLRAPLLGKTMTRLTSQSLGKSTLDV